MDINELRAPDPAVVAAAAREPVAWVNPRFVPFGEIKDSLQITAADIDDAEARLRRFAPFIARRFPETMSAGGIIESPLVGIPRMRERLNGSGADIAGGLLLKRDDMLPVSGSVKARGGIYEVLLRAESVALENGLLDSTDGDYTVFCSDRARELFSRYSIHVGSTGNLGLSIGIMGAALGFRAVVHMSADAKQWKKDLLRSRGAVVREYDADYGEAVRRGREEAIADDRAYFVDDERSPALFAGYATAARRLHRQLDGMGITVDGGHPLIVYIPCGVGGAPGGIAFGLAHEFGDDAMCCFAEPTEAPCMLLGLCTGLGSGISVSDIGLSGRTIADGLAVGRPSGLVCDIIGRTVRAAATVPDGRLYGHLRALYDSEGIFIEPSACAGFEAAVMLGGERGPLAQTLSAGGYAPGSATHIVWATGGSMVPRDERDRYMKQ